MDNHEEEIQRAGAPSALNIGLEAVHCPNCPDQGWYRDSDGEQEQCEFCYTVPNSAFNIEASNVELRGCAQLETLKER